MGGFALLFTLSAVGIAETAYLVRMRLEEERPVCPVGSGCAPVLTSRYNRVFGLHNDLIGLLFYVAMATLTALLVVGAGPASLWFFAAAVLMTIAPLFTAYLMFLQGAVIKAWCFWCLMSAVTVTGMDFILLMQAVK